MIDVPTESTPTIPPGSDRAAVLDRDEIAALRAIVEGTARSTGDGFFQSLVRHLASALGVSYAFVAEFAGDATRVRTLAYWGRGRIKDNVEFDLAGTPCEDVVRGGLCHHPQGVREKFPRDQDLIDLGIESYLGVPLLDGDGKVLGHLAVFDERPHARRAAPAVHLPDLRHPGRRRARAAAGREAARRERAPLPRPLRGGAERLCVVRRSTGGS